MQHEDGPRLKAAASRRRNFEIPTSICEGGDHSRELSSMRLPIVSRAVFCRPGGAPPMGGWLLPPCPASRRPNVFPLSSGRLAFRPDARVRLATFEEEGTGPVRGVCDAAQPRSRLWRAPPPAALLIFYVIAVPIAHPDRRADRAGDLDGARRAAQALDPSRHTRANRDSPDLRKNAARAAPGRAAPDAVVIRCWKHWPRRWRSSPRGKSSS